MRNIGEHIDSYAVDDPKRHDPTIDRTMLQVARWDNHNYPLARDPPEHRRRARGRSATLQRASPGADGLRELPPNMTKRPGAKRTPTVRKPTR